MLSLATKSKFFFASTAVSVNGTIQLSANASTAGKLILTAVSEKAVGALKSQDNTDTVTIITGASFSVVKAVNVQAIDTSTAAQTVTYDLKYKNKRQIADFFADQIWEYLGEWIKKSDYSAIIPVPISEHKMKIRGYNQAELISRKLSLKAGIVHRPECLIRTSDTAPQRLLGRLERKNNLKNSIFCYKNGLYMNDSE